MSWAKIREVLNHQFPYQLLQLFLQKFQIYIYTHYYIELEKLSCTISNNTKLNNISVVNPRGIHMRMSLKKKLLCNILTISFLQLIV